MARARRKVRWGVAGLGWITQDAILPAFAHARRNSELVTLFSDDEEKMRVLGRKYGIARSWSYADFETGLAREAVDAVFIALPNHRHHEFTLRAARAGVHVLCEKPMAPTTGECGEMIRACRSARVRLMIAYRLHFEAANLRALAIAKSGRIGKPRLLDARFTMQVEDGDNIRLRRRTGGGPLLDIGIYCVNAARTLFRAEPLEVSAFAARGAGDDRFEDVDEAVAAVLRFPGERLATISASFGAAPVSSFRITGTKGDLRVEPAFSHSKELAHHLLTGEKPRERTFEKRDQFAPEIIHFAKRVLAGRDPEPSGEEGLADLRVIEAIERSIASGRAVRLPPARRRRRPTPRQEIRRPPVRKRKLVRARAPH